ncbi:uncharacterized protein FA14DRAFT_72068 [Meira miltonrushii]|uniref:Uncharacterized protein n=1 Tax=Meira miltonrushii TaxID=1280837 RepID=A0A316VFY5_9BASI|nr:uncharacterized protein FA14DRAFT_72068 [Meira miltonrushii]PWN34395.1 hypothetical protein FA14DRAFT_72068 [Meira miltonrushii]
MVRSRILMLPMLWLPLLFWLNDVLGQTKEQKDFDLNKTPPPEDSSEDEVIHSHQPMENKAIDVPTTIEAKVNQSKKKRKRKSETITKDRAERKKVHDREMARERRKGIRERRLAGTLTESDKRSLERLKAEKKRYAEKHKEHLAKYNSNYRRNHLSECAAKSRRWRSRNPGKSKRSE